MPQAMSWDEWAKHDAVALAERIQRGELTPREAAAQAEAAIGRRPL
jgi:amidase